MQPQELVVSESRKLSCEMPALRRRVCRIYVHVFVVMARMGLTLRRGTDRDTYASTRLAWCSASYCMRQCAPPRRRQKSHASPGQKTENTKKWMIAVSTDTYRLQLQLEVPLLTDDSVSTLGHLWPSVACAWSVVHWSSSHTLDTVTLPPDRRTPHGHRVRQVTQTNGLDAPRQLSTMQSLEADVNKSQMAERIVTGCGWRHGAEQLPRGDTRRATTRSDIEVQRGKDRSLCEQILVVGEVKRAAPDAQRGWHALCLGGGRVGNLTDASCRRIIVIPGELRWSCLDGGAAL